MSEKRFLFAGFGGQGILFTGKYLAYEGLLQGKEVSWLPSYGPEMRGGTANCSVIISDTSIGSPIITTHDVLIAMNLPSLDKFEPETVEGGKIFVDSSLIGRKVARTDVDAYYIPATQLASDKNLPGLANMIILGNVIRQTGVMDVADLARAMRKIVSERRQDMIDLNIKAIELGYNYQ
ncbi:MAG: 2-oxoacid:acceptor oxidoreductase family protein [Oscillospiraceae bacterium]|nr:2-oxoacid:acceptor oxidoreductase family protein [Oscillospiraceae bacterium]